MHRNITENTIRDLIASYDDIQRIIAEAIGEIPEEIDIQRSELGDDDRVGADVIIEVLIQDPDSYIGPEIIANTIFDGLRAVLPYACYKMRVIPERSATISFMPNVIVDNQPASS